MIATKQCLTLLSLLLLVGIAASRPLLDADPETSQLHPGFPLKEHTSPQYRVDAWRESSLQTKRGPENSLDQRASEPRDSARSLDQRARQKRASVSLGFDTNGFNNLLNSFVNAVINLVTFRVNVR